MKNKSITFGVIFTLAVSALLFFADVVPVPRLRRATPSNAEKTNPALPSTYYLCIRITNKIFTETLKNENSEDYMQLKKQVEQMLYVVYSPLSYGKYEGIINMIFSNGSVIANSTLMFRSTNYIHSNLIKSTFTNNIQTYPSKTIDRDVTFPEGQLPLEATLLQVGPLTAIITSTPPHNPAVPAIANRRPRQANTPNETNLSGNITKLETTTITPKPNNGMEGSTIPRETTKTTKSINTNSSPGETTKTPKSINTSSSPGETTKTTKSINITSSPGETTKTTKSINTNSSPGETTKTPKSINTSSSPGETTKTPKSINTTSSPGETIKTTKSINTTSSPGEIIKTTKSINTSSSPGETTKTTKTLTTTSSPGETTKTTKSINTSSSPGETTKTPKSINTTSRPGETTKTPKSINTISSPGETTKTTKSKNTTSSPGETINTTKTLITTKSPRETTNTTKTLITTGGPIAMAGGAGVPGWGIALLVLAALILLLLLVLLILLLVWWCCSQRNRSYSTYDQINHGGDIPMYSTHSRFDVTNSIPYEEMDAPSKNRTGTYIVNK